MKDEQKAKIQGFLDKVLASEEVWKKPWFVTKPRNVETGTEYKGGNRFWLELIAIMNGWPNQWIGYGGAKKLGGHVKKGEIGTPIITFRPPILEEKNGKLETVRPPFFGSAYVFNITQVEGIEVAVPAENPVRKIDEAEMFIPTEAVIKYGYDHAAFSPRLDEVHMPAETQFKSQSGFYSTLMHELTHWTGHESRLARINERVCMDKTVYSEEELVAEIGSTMILSELGVDDQNQAAAYVKSWYQNIRDDPQVLWRAAGKAEKAVEYLRGAA